MSGVNRYSFDSLQPLTPLFWCQIHGLDKLNPKEQAGLKGELSDPEPPAHIEELDPSDASFTKAKALLEVEPPEAITLSLLPYQKEGFGWMVEREADPTCRGGILADEMGMGKVSASRFLMPFFLKCNRPPCCGREGRSTSWISSDACKNLII